MCLFFLYIISISICNYNTYIELSLCWPKNLDHIKHVIQLFSKLIEIKDTFTLKYLSIKFRLKSLSKTKPLPSSQSASMTSLLTKITHLTSIKAISIYPLTLAPKDRKYLQEFWFVDPFGECYIPKYGTKCEEIMKFRELYVALYSPRT